MTDIAHHIRIFEGSPSDDFVEKRKLAISALVDAFKKRSSYSDQIALANDIAGVFTSRAHLSEATTSQVVAAISDQSPSFDKDERPEEIKICAALGALTWLEGAGNSSGAATRVDMFGLALWSALSFQKPSTNAKIEALRGELVSTSRDLVVGSAEAARQRSVVPDASFALAEGDQLAQMEKKLKDTAIKAINALRVNAALDREEIDVLWWALGDWSNILNKRFSALASEQAALVGSIELAKLLKRLPSDAHRHLVLRHIADVNKKHDLADFLANLGDSRDSAGATFKANALLTPNPLVFPLLNALNAADPKPNGGKLVRGLDEWGARALLETAILHLAALPLVIS